MSRLVGYFASWRIRNILFLLLLLSGIVPLAISSLLMVRQNADILETRESLILRVELPGVEPQSLSVSVHGGNIIIRGEKTPPQRDPMSQIHAEERAFGPFRRVIRLEVPVNTRQAEAALLNGLLRISFPKVPNRRGEEVPIEVQLR